MVEEAVAAAAVSLAAPLLMVLSLPALFGVELLLAYGEVAFLLRFLEWRSTEFLSKCCLLKGHEKFNLDGPDALVLPFPPLSVVLTFLDRLHLPTYYWARAGEESDGR